MSPPQKGHFRRKGEIIGLGRKDIAGSSGVRYSLPAEVVLRAEMVLPLCDSKVASGDLTPYSPGLHRNTRFLAAPTSSTRRTGVVWGAFKTISGASSHSRAISRIAATN